MSDSLATRRSLLVRLRDASDAEAWSQFVDLYGPLIYGHARRSGLQEEDAADVTQEVLRAFVGAVGGFEYDPHKGSFRGWLFTVTRNELRTFFAKRQGRVQAAGGGTMHQVLEQQPSREEEASAIWDEEYQRRLFSWVADQVRQDFRDSTWQAFWLTAVHGKSGKEVAETLGMTTAAVYLARGRVLARIKEQIRLLEGTAES